jgi:hypothetical protein
MSLFNRIFSIGLAIFTVVYLAAAYASLLHG